MLLCLCVNVYNKSSIITLNIHFCQVPIGDEDKDETQLLVLHVKQLIIVVLIFTARAYARAVLGVVILSVRLSVCPSVCLSHAWIVTKLNDALRIF